MVHAVAKESVGGLKSDNARGMRKVMKKELEDRMRKRERKARVQQLCT